MTNHFTFDIYVMGKELNFDQINQTINFPHFRVDVCEMEGCLLGLLSTSNSVSINHWLSCFDLDKVVLSKNQFNQLEQFHRFYQNYDWHNDYCPDFLFVQSDDLTKKVNGLKQFSAGFLFAIGLNPNEFDRLNEHCREFLGHLIDFSGISIEELSVDESDNREFEELYEFTRAGVSLMMVENPVSKNRYKNESNHFHPSEQIH